MTEIQSVHFHAGGQYSSYALAWDEVYATDNKLAPSTDDQRESYGKGYGTRQLTYEIDGHRYELLVNAAAGMWGWSSSHKLIGHVEDHILYIHLVDDRFIPEQFFNAPRTCSPAS